MPERFISLSRFFDGVVPEDPTVTAIFEGVCPADGKILSIPRTRLAEETARRLMLSLPDCEPKMFGILLARAPSGEIGVLRAFSGKLEGSFHHPGWVPPMLELQPSELEVSTKNRLEELKQHLRGLSQTPNYRERRTVRGEWERRSGVLRQRLKKRKEERNRRRAAGEPEEQLAAESKHDSREKREFRKERALALQVLDRLEEEVFQLKAERKSLSRALQAELHARFESSLWREQPWSLASLFPSGPPTGTGECCAPKLLHFARVHQLQPLALAEFWWGDTTENRRRGEFYPPCEERCRPLLGPLLTNATGRIGVLYHDARLLVVNKPSGLLTVPGRQTWTQDSVVSRLQEEWGPLFCVHRLDLETSGLLVLARNPEDHGSLQKQFAERRVSKTYQALLERLPPSSLGEIDTAIQGKSAITSYRLVNEGEKRFDLRPITGRTHQLRVHCARDLKSPIQGDTRHGRGLGPRLMLHARKLRFRHPATGEFMDFRSPVPF